jgi:hypothetical protein
VRKTSRACEGSTEADRSRMQVELGTGGDPAPTSSSRLIVPSYRAGGSELDVKSSAHRQETAACMEANRH